MPQGSPPLFSVRRSASILALALIAALGLFSSEVWAQSAVEEKPSNLTAQVVAAGIQLNWNAPQARAAEVDGYQILRRRPDEGEALLLVLVADTGSTTTRYLDATATEPGVSYIYRVKARRGHELSRIANKVQLTYTAPEPQPTLQPEPAPTLETTPALEPEPAPAGVTVELGDITDLQRPQFLVGELDGGAETVNRYRFTISEPKKLGLGLRQQETNADLVLVDAEGAELRAARKAGAANEWITVTLLAGAYEARIEAQEAGVSTYMFRYGVEAPNPTVVQRLLAELQQEEQEPDPVIATQQQATPADLAPSNLSAESTAGGVQLTWEAPAADAASVTGYRIIRTHIGANGGADVTDEIETGSTDLSYLDAAANIEGVTYTYQVTALREGVASEATSAVTVTYLWASLAPTNLRATITADGVLLEWDAPAVGVTSVITYDVTRTGTDARGSYLRMQADIGSTRLLFLDRTVLRVGPDTYLVQAVRRTGSSAASNEVTVFYQTELLAPSNLRAALTADGVQLEWDAPAADAASVTGYRITRTQAGAAGGADVTTEIETDSTDPSYLDAAANLESAAYTYQVTAVRRGVASEASNEVTVTYLWASLAPSNLRAASTAGGVQLEWDAPAADAASVTGYRITRTQAGAAGGADVTTEIETDSTDLSHLDAAANVESAAYTYQVAAVRGVVSSEASNEVTVTYLWASLAPSNLRAALTADGVQLEWDAPAADAASVTGYRITRTQAGAAGGADVTTEIDTGSTDLSHLDAAANVESAAYTYQVAAVRGVVSSEASNEVTVTYLWASLAPSNLRVLSSDFVVQLEWDAPAADAASVTGYRIKRTKTKADGTEVRTQIDIGRNRRAYSDNTVDISVSAYTYQVHALRGGVRSEASNDVTVNYGRSWAPSNLSADSRGDGMALTWDAPDRGTQYVTNYVVKRTSIGGAGGRTITEDTPSTGRDYLDRTDMVEGETYSYTVNARFDWGDLSQPSDALIVTYLPEQQGLPTAPGGLRAVYQPDDAIVLEWDLPLEDGASVTGYEVTWLKGPELEVYNARRWEQPHPIQWGQPESVTVDSTTTSYRSTSPSGWGTALRREDWGRYYNFSVRALRADGEHSRSHNVIVQLVPQLQELMGPNDDYSADISTTGSVTVDGSVSGTMEVPLDRDWFAVELQAGQTYFLDVIREERPNRRGYYARWLTSVHDSEGRSIPGTIAAYNGKYGNAALPFTPLESGTHYIAVGNIEDARWFSVGAYTVGVRAVSLPELQLGEIGEQPSTSRLINVGDTVLSSMDYIVRTNHQMGDFGEWYDFADIDWWRVRLEPDVSYAIEMKGWSTGDGTLIDPQLLRLRDPHGAPINGIEIWDDVEGQVGPASKLVNHNSLIVITPRVAADYHILATANNDWYDPDDGLEEQEPGTYTVAVNVIEDLTPDVPADTRTSASVAVDGEPYVGRIIPIYDSDWVAVELEAANTYHIAVNVFPGHGIPMKDVGSAGVFDANGLRLPGSGMYGGWGSLPSYYDAAIVTPGKSGTYYIDVRGLGRGVGDYALTVTLVDTATQETIDAIADDVEMLEVDAPVIVALEAAESRWFAIQLDAGETYHFLHTTELWEGVIHGLYDDSGELVAWDPGQRKPAVENRDYLREKRLSYTPVFSGTYYIRVARGVQRRIRRWTPPPVDYTLSVSLIESEREFSQKDRDAKLFVAIVRELETKLQPGVMTTDEASLEREVRWYTMALEGGARYWLSVRSTVPLEDVHPGLIDPSLAQPYIRVVFTDQGEIAYSAPHKAGRIYDIDLDLLPAESCIYHFGILSQYLAPYNVSVTKLADGDGDAPVCGQGDDGIAGGESDEEDDSNGDVVTAVQVVAESTDLPADIDTPGVVEVGVISRGEIEEVGDADWFRVSLNAGVTYQIDMEGLWTGYADSSGTWVGVGTLVDPLLSAIYDASGQLIPGSGDQTEEGNGGTGQNSRTVFTPASSGDYFIEATATSAWLGTYVLIVTELE